ncbi:hypothetical protein NE236_13145 [Actinoallomurus purpureus]|uniref:hypothetical protein n=1 Tax=Actinoallomurus purpureus TaxID=478114 RepID=UPI00209220FD|nr:hypothetical protein [Actinoallomurus purpureus]MCO6005932.1 hypothetical protein [Actinoallomurus purpureus]
MAIKRTLAGLGALALIATGPVSQAQATASAKPVTAGPAQHGHKPFHRGMEIERKKKTPSFRRLSRTLAAGEHQLQATVLDRKGVAATSDEVNTLFIWPLNGDDPSFADVVNGHAEGSLPPGDYTINATVKTPEPDGTTSTSLIYLPKVTVAGDVSLTLDARKANPVHVEVDKAGAKPAGTVVWVSQRIGGVFRDVTEIDGDHLYVTPAAADGGVEYELQALLTQGGEEEGSPYAYNVATKAAGIPTDPNLSARTKDLAAVRVEYAGEGRPACAQQYAGVDFGSSAIAVFRTVTGGLPATRTEYYTPGFDWDLTGEITTPDCAFDQYDVQFRNERFPKAGTYTRSWNKGPLGPADGELVLDTGDGTGYSAAMLSGPDGLSNVGSYAFLKGDSALESSTGESIGQSLVPGYGQIWARPEPGRYTLTTNATRTAPWSDLATSQHVVWDVTVGQDNVIKLPTVQYQTALDDTNRARANTTQTLTVVPQQAKAGAEPALWTSFDDGKSWTPVPVRADGDRWVASFRNPAKGSVSLRTKIDGAVDQTVIRAYGVR